MTYRHVEVEYSITGRRKRVHQGYVMQDVPGRDEIDFLFFYTETGRGKRRVSFDTTVPRKSIRRIIDIEMTPEDVRELTTVYRKEMKQDLKVRMAWFDLEVQITDKGSDVYHRRVANIRDDKTRLETIKSIHHIAKMLREFAERFDNTDVGAEGTTKFEIVKSIRHSAKVFNEFAARFN